MKKRQELKKLFFCILGSVLLASAVIGLPKKTFAIDVGGVEIHGYGHQTFMITDGNEYMNADDDGSWENNMTSILFTSKVTDETTIWIQLHGGADGVRVDWAFVDYMFNDNLSVQIGQIKYPVGIYNDIRDVRFLQLSTMLPYMYSENADIIHEAYRGVRAIYNLDLGSGGEIIFTPFTGQPFSTDAVPKHTYGQMFGGNITYNTPLDGLSLTGSASKSDTYVLDQNMNMKGDMTMLNTSVSYVNYGFDLKAEYITMDMSMSGMPNGKSSSYYAQAGYTFFDKLTPFVRYDSITTDENNNSDPSNYQKSIVAGVGYKINYNVSLKAAYHINDGYALADSGTEENWNMFVTSINFIF